MFLRLWYQWTDRTNSNAGFEVRKIRYEGEGKRKKRRSLFFFDPLTGSTCALITVVSNRLTSPKHINRDRLLRVSVTGFRRTMRLRLRIGTGWWFGKKNFLLFWILMNWGVSAVLKREHLSAPSVSLSTVLHSTVQSFLSITLFQTKQFLSESYVTIEASKTSETLSSSKTARILTIL